MRSGKPQINIIGILLLLISVSIAASTPAHAYIDPGTGSLIIQSVIGAIAAIGVTMKLYWHKLKLLFSGRSAQSKVDAPATEKPSSK